jgi:hypothetical protein
MPESEQHGIQLSKTRSVGDAVELDPEMVEFVRFKKVTRHSFLLLKLPFLRKGHKKGIVRHKSREAADGGL